MMHRVIPSVVEGSILLVFIGFFLIFGISPIFAVSISFSNAPITIDQVQEFTIDASLICSGCTSDSYIRSVFYPNGTSYFGYTQDNGGNWINAPGGGCTQYFKIPSNELTQEGSWSGKLKVKPDTSSPFYSGPGDYLFKIGRYSTSCSTPAWSTEITMTITGPTPTPSTTPSFTPTPKPNDTPTPTPSPKPQSSPTSKPSITPVRITPTPTDKITPSPKTNEDDSGGGTVLGESESSPSSSSTSKNSLYLPLMLFLIGGGLIFISASLFLAYRQRDLRKNLLKPPKP